MGLFRKLFGGGSQPPPPTSEQYLLSLVDGIQAKERAQGYAGLTPAEKVFFCVWTLEAEVNNGGFSQFYFNSAGDIAAEVPGALRAIGAGHTASIVARANGLFGAEGPPRRSRRTSGAARATREFRGGGIRGPRSGVPGVS